MKKSNAFCSMLLLCAFAATSVAETREIRVGIIGLDTSHAPNFVKLLNKKDALPDLANCRVVAAYPKGSPDIESSTSRVPNYTKQVQAMGVEIVPSIEDLIARVDCVLLETNDGRPHLEQLLPVLKAGKPTFVDKPIAGDLADAIAIFAAAKKYKTPVFSSSSLRFSAGAQAHRKGEMGEVVGCDAYSPCHLEKTHPDLYWYGIHGVETLFTVMGPGCVEVTRVTSANMDLVVGKWNDGRIGTFRGVREVKSGYGGTAFTKNGPKPIGGYDGYRPLLVEIVKFFRTGKTPIDERETLELYAFMTAADMSKKNGGRKVTIAEALQQARPLAKKRLAALDK